MAPIQGDLSENGCSTDATSPVSRYTAEDDDEHKLVHRSRANHLNTLMNSLNEVIKTTDGVGCLNTLMNSLNEVISVTKLR